MCINDLCGWFLSGHQTAKLYFPILVVCRLTEPVLSAEPKSSVIECTSNPRSVTRPFWTRRPISGIFAYTFFQVPGTSCPYFLHSSVLLNTELCFSSGICRLALCFFSGLFSDFEEENCLPVTVASHSEWPLKHTNTRGHRAVYLSLYNHARHHFQSFL